MPTFSSTADGYEMRTGQPADGVHSVLIQTPISAGWNATSAHRFNQYQGVELDGSFTAGSVHGWPTAGVITGLRFYVLGTPGDPASKQLLYEISGASYDAAQFHSLSEAIWPLFEYMIAGNDTLVGGPCDDDLVGGAGDDLYLANSWFDWTWEDANEGYDTVQASSSYTLRQNVERLELTGSGDTYGTGNNADNVILGNTGSNVLTGWRGDDVLDGGDGFDTLAGGLGDDVLTGGAGNDELVGGGDNDRMFGGSGSDRLGGGGGNDRLIGGGGSDRLNGGQGNDRMTGGSGSDTFIFASAPGFDAITDFAAGAGSDDVLAFDSALFADFADVMAHAHDTARGVVIHKDGLIIRLEGVSRAALHSDDFSFWTAPDAAPAADWMV